MSALRPALLGVLLAVATAVTAILLGRPRGPELLAAILVAAAAVYPGAALAERRRGVLLLETLLTVGFVAAALCGLWFSSTLLALGYFGHGAWDFLHHPRRVGASAGSFFPPLCLVYDVAVGVFILGVYP